MACAGFTCSKNALLGLNIMYILVGFILIAVAAYGQTANVVTSIKLIGGIIACGVFLLLVSILGLIGAIKHHQVILFFYMVILFLLFIIQFSIACACLAMNNSQQETLAEAGWRHADDTLKGNAQTYFDCCSYDENSTSLYPNSTMGHPTCVDVPNCCPQGKRDNCCYDSPVKCGCPPCKEYLVEAVHAGLKASGGIGLFFSFTEFIGVFLTVRYRNQKDPRANPRDFI